MSARRRRGGWVADEGLRRALEEAPVAITALDRRCRLTAWNRAAEGLFGWQRGEVLGRLPPTVPAADAPSFRSWIADVFATGAVRSAEERRLHRDGSDRWARSVALPLLVDGEPVGVAELLVDLTELRHALAALELSEQRFRIAADATQGLVADWDIASGRVVRSSGIERLLGLGPDEAAPTADWWFERIHPDDREAVERLVETRLAGSAGRWETTYRIRHASGRWLHVAHHASVVRDAAGAAVRVISHTVDVTPAREAEERIREALAAADRARVRTARLQDVTAALARAVDLEETLDAIVAQAHTTLGADGALVSLLRPDDVVELVRSVGVPDDVVAGAARLPLAARRAGPDAIRTRSPSWIGSRADWRRSSPTSSAVAAGFEARAAVPLLRVSGEAMGALVCLFREARAFAADDRALLEAVAGQCAQALERAGLFEAERQARRAAERLQGVTAALTRAATRRQVCEALVNEGVAVVGAAAGWCSLLDEREQLELVVQRGFPSELVERFRSFPLDVDAVAAQVTRQRSAVWFRDGAEHAARFPSSAALIGRPHDASAVLALAHGDEPLGFFSIEHDRAHDWTGLERNTLLAMASQAAQALARARLFEEERSFALALQRSLLPRATLETRRVRAAATYRPASETHDVGGDWYDLLETRDGGVLLSVGDVVGHGTEAAATMSLLAHASRAYARLGQGPAEILRSLNALVHAEHADGFFATAFLLHVAADGATITAACAGHPPALLRGDDGRVVPVRPTGLPLGVAPHARYEPIGLVVPSPALVVLYTDGLVERRGRPLDEGLAWLGQQLETLNVSELDLVAELARAASGGIASHDDTVVLAARTLPGSTRPLRVALDPSPAAISVARTRLREWLLDSPVPQRLWQDVLLAAGEACTNAVEHAQVGGEQPARIALTASRTADDLTVRISNRGRWRQSSGDPARGFGIPIMRQTSEQVAIRTGARSTTVELSWGLERPAARQGAGQAS
ncbi:MAG: SpoIIE family protein phosphatase [Thermoleophilia bacterium]